MLLEGLVGGAGRAAWVGGAPIKGVLPGVGGVPEPGGAGRAGVPLGLVEVTGVGPIGSWPIEGCIGWWLFMGGVC